MCCSELKIVQCAGNRRTEMSKARTVKGVGWDVSAIGNGTHHTLEWTVNLMSASFLRKMNLIWSRPLFYLTPSNSVRSDNLKMLVISYICCCFYWCFSVQVFEMSKAFTVSYPLKASCWSLGKRGGCVGTTTIIQLHKHKLSTNI